MPSSERAWYNGSYTTNHGNETGLVRDLAVRNCEEYHRMVCVDFGDNCAEEPHNRPVGDD